MKAIDRLAIGKEVTGRIAVGARIDWAALAADLGYADHAHLTRDFADVFGEPPTQYARRHPASASGARRSSSRAG